MAVCFNIVYCEQFTIRLFTNILKQVTMKEKFRLASTYSPLLTLANMKGGTTVLIPTAKIKTVSLRSAATTLKKQGYIFHVTVKGLINETSVTCIKSPKR